MGEGHDQDRKGTITNPVPNTRCGQTNKELKEPQGLHGEIQDNH